MSDTVNASSGGHPGANETAPGKRAAISFSRLIECSAGSCMQPCRSSLANAPVLAWSAASMSRFPSLEGHEEPAAWEPVLNALDVAEAGRAQLFLPLLLIEQPPAHELLVVVGDDGAESPLPVVRRVG